MTWETEALPVDKMSGPMKDKCKMFYSCLGAYTGIMIALSCLCACGSRGEQTDEEGPLPKEVSYNLHIRPILSDNCFTCHGPDANKREAGLRLDIAEEAYNPLKENPDFHAIVPGEPKSSMVFFRITSDDKKEMMPPPESNRHLTRRQLRLIEKWIRQGAKYEKHWAFVPPGEPEVPEVDREGWARNEIDHFILSRQEEAALNPNPEAGSETLLRRLSLDITGLPPGIPLMDSFMRDDSEAGYEATVDRLFASKAYGEKMAANWMDVARYADSHGYQDDYYRTQWPWRDWVIHAFNKNLPYDQFITWQLAGDLLPDRNSETILATAFNRNHKITEESGAIDEEYRVAYVVDRTNTFGKALLGMTVECANCHDHKFDPISQKEYFQLYAFFNNVAEYGIEEITPGFSKKGPAKQPILQIRDDEVGGILSFINKPDSARLARAVIGDETKGRNFEMLKSEAGVLRVSVMGELDTLRKTFLLERGAYDAHGEEVLPGTPESILAFPGNYPANRLGLARWLFDENNPLTARVFVNRVWQDIFGVGLVTTPGDFGMQGKTPTHAALLDWLARDFMKSGWDIKRLMKKIVMSSTYRQSSTVDPDKLRKDPDNRLLARYPRYRLSAPGVRDVILASSGLLVPIVGGPSVRPYQPPGLWEAATSGRGNLTTYKQDTLEALYRRGLYTFIKRTVPPPSMILFDASSRDECAVEQVRTNTPLQALVMLNDPTVLEASKVLAAKLLQEQSTEAEKIAKAFRLIVGRRPDEKEVVILEKFYREQLRILQNDLTTAKKLLEVGEYRIEITEDARTWAALMQVVHTIYNLEETIMKS